MNTNFGIVILAAGLGTRMKSRHAKVLHRAGGRTLIELVTDTARRLAPPSQIYVVVGHQAELVQQAVEGCGVGCLVQKEQLGTGHAILVGREALLAGPHTCWCSMAIALWWPRKPCPP